MDVRIAQPLGYSEMGGRNNNEDSIFPDPQHASPQQKWFLVCDGVGGAERGEVASALAVTSFDTFLRQQPVSVPTDDYLRQAVSYVENQFNDYFTENPKALGMATTMTMLYLHEAGATVAHIGDSRVYHIRNGEVIWRTDDHSYVNELVKAGVLTPSEAHRHPQRNIITRALQGGDKRVLPSVQLINDLRPGDYFFLCSDGVLERVSDELLEGTLRSQTVSNEQKLSSLHGYSVGNTRDNFTAYLVQIEQVSGPVDPLYQVAPPVYERTSTDMDADEAITLINMPVPEIVSPTPVLPVEEYRTRPAPKLPEVPIMPDPPARLTNTDRPRPMEAPGVQRRSPVRLSVVLLALVGALIGAGGVFIGQQFINKTGLFADAHKSAGDSTGNKLSEKKTNPASSSDSARSMHPVESSGKTTDAGFPSPASSSVADNEDKGDAQGLIADQLEEKPANTNSSPAKNYTSIKQVDSQLSVVKDTRNDLVGLRKNNGEWVTKRFYSKIGTFENSVAPVKTTKGSVLYLNKEGKEFKSRSEYKDGVATLVSMDGTNHYLAKGGTWLDEVKEPSNGKIAVRKAHYWGYLNMQGEISLFLKYDNVESFGEDGTAEVTLNGKTYRIDRKGDKIVSKGNSPATDKKSGGKKEQSSPKAKA